ncbi:response regulator [Pontimicrobium sp. MEBiC01747]
MNATNLNLALVDDDKLIVELLKNFFVEDTHISINIIAHHGHDFIKQLHCCRTIPDIVLLDLRMQKMNGVDTMAVLKKDFPDIKIIVLSSHYKPTFIGFILKSGANAFIPKDTGLNDLLKIIEEVHTKGHYFLPNQIEVIREQILNNSPKPILEEKQLLTDREMDVLKLICSQYTAKEIGEKLFITQRTVEGHKNRILLKTGVKNTAGLVIYSIQNNIINPDEFFLG